MPVLTPNIKTTIFSYMQSILSKLQRTAIKLTIFVVICLIVKVTDEINISIYFLNP